MGNGTGLTGRMVKRKVLPCRRASGDISKGAGRLPSKKVEQTGNRESGDWFSSGKKREDPVRKIKSPKRWNCKTRKEWIDGPGQGMSKKERTKKRRREKLVYSNPNDSLRYVGPAPRTGKTRGTRKRFWVYRGGHQPSKEDKPSES